MAEDSKDNGPKARSASTNSAETSQTDYQVAVTTAALEGFTGRYIVLSKRGADTKTTQEVLEKEAGFKIEAVTKADDPFIDSKSIPENEGLLFPEMGIAVVNPNQDTLGSLSATVAKSPSLDIMEQERFVYAESDMDMQWLKGFRDATNKIYDYLTNPDTPQTPFATQVGFEESQNTWGLQATQVLKIGETGKGVKIAILDTGIDLAHPDFRGRAITAASFIKDEEVADGHGHGTHCAGIAGGPFQPSSLPRYGVAHEAELLIAKVLANSGRGTDASIIAGLNWAIANKADIISMSLGAKITAAQNYSAIYQEIAEVALAKGILIVAAAGNDSRRPDVLEPVSHPANCPGIMAVGAVDRNYRIGYFSNAGLNVNGGKVDVAAPGLDIYSTFPSGTQSYKRLDGTSMATPFVAGIAALYAQRTKLRGNALWAQLVRAALPLGETARDVGAGLVQA